MERIGDKISDITKRSVKKTNLTAVLNEAGKLPPQALDLEEAVLGALMLSKEPVNDVIDILKPEAFYKDTHQRIYAAIQELFASSEAIDILTVTNQLRKKGELDLIGGPYYISQLTNRVASTAHIETHARIIVQKYILRELIRISSDVIRDAFDDTTDVFDLLNQAESQLFSVAEGNIRKQYDSMSSVIRQALEEIESAKNNDGGLSGIPSGFTKLDKITAGWQRSDMVVIAARPGMGKTAFVLSMARNIAVDFKKPVAVFSLEMSSIQLVKRLIASEAEIESDKLRKGNLSEIEHHQLHEKIKRLAEAPIFIDDTPALSVFELRAKCRRLKQQHNIDLVIIDYLQLMKSANGGNREQEISSISRSIKEIAKELNIPIIALSQLSRNVEQRGGDKRPQLSDLRESGAIEQDADQVMFIYRPEYYGLTEDEQGRPTNNIGEIIIAKNRHGSTDTVQLGFIGKYTKFINLDTFDNNGTSIDGLMTRGSKMNEDFEDDSFSNQPLKNNNFDDDQVPF
ncbi:MAG: replicative DNA helicase [Bacteroidia bacterium]